MVGAKIHALPREKGGTVESSHPGRHLGGATGGQESAAEGPPEEGGESYTFKGGAFLCNLFSDYDFIKSKKQQQNLLG